MCCVQEWLVPLATLLSFPLNEIYRGKLVSSITVIIPYLLAVTLSVTAYHLLLVQGICHPF